MSGSEVAYEEGIIKKEDASFSAGLLLWTLKRPRGPEVCLWFVLGGLFALLEPKFKKSCLAFRL